MALYFILKNKHKNVIRTVLLIYKDYCCCRSNVDEMSFVVSSGKLWNSCDNILRMGCRWLLICIGRNSTFSYYRWMTIGLLWKSENQLFSWLVSLPSKNIPKIRWPIVSIDLCAMNNKYYFRFFNNLTYFYFIVFILLS